jgi:hypothetical protein
MWVWEQPPTSLLARYGSIRGASSFGASYPKVFIDGIEVANPLLVNRIVPEGIDRVEVIRGPQGAALYGIDAISGVINIVTRHEGVDTGAPSVRIRSNLGVAESSFAPQATLAQNHAVALRTGTSAHSAGLNLGFGSVGEFVPEGDSRHISASGNARLVGARSIVTGTARFFTERAGVPANPLLSGVVRPPADTASPTPGADAEGPQTVRQYTAGVTTMYMPNERWTHSLVVGIDGDRLDGVPDDQTVVPSAAESMPRTATAGERFPS